MIRVAIAVQDQSLGQQIQGTVLEVDDTEVVFISTSTTELTGDLLRADVDVVLVHETLGPEPVLSVVRDLSIRRPTTAMLLVAQEPDAETMAAAMDAGARGVVALPLTYAQLEARLTAVAAWSSQMRRAFAQGPSGPGLGDDGGRGRLVGVAGAKGGVGTTTVVTHLALDIARSVPDLGVCLVDLDLEKGDVPGHVEVRHRLGISDLAKVAEDLSPGTVADAMTHHASGVHLLLAPPDIREVESVTPQALRQIVAALRRQYDLVLVDLGSHATPAQATVLELVDEVVLVVNPDVAAMRGMRRTINAWDSLGVCKESDIRVLVNRTSKQVTVSMETVRQLTKASVIPVGLPAGFRRLEPALNARDPLVVRGAWWTELRKIGREIGLVSTTTPERPATARPGAQAASASVPAVMTEEPRTEQEPSPATSRRLARERGSLTLESIGMIPLLGLIGLLVWHLTMFGAATVLQSHAAAAATRAASIGDDPQAAAEDSLPRPYRDEVRVDHGIDGLEVSMGIPGFVDGFPGLPTEITTSRQVVEEP